MRHAIDPQIRTWHRYQLIQANYPSPAPYNGEVHGWTYDAIGNRLTNAVNGVPQTYTYFKNGANPLNGQRLSSDSDNAYTYDANGNTLTRNGSGGSFTFGWNADDRMTSISGAVTASYGYDHQGRKTSKTVSGTTTTYLYDGLNLIQAAGSNAMAYLFGPGIDEPLATVQGGNVAYLSVDGLGSVAILSDAAGVAQAEYYYDIWGGVKSHTGLASSPFGYTARESAEAGLWYYRARYYQPAVGRFLSEDPLGKSRDGVESFFAYAGNDPVSLTDPTGEQLDASKPPYPPDYPLWGSKNCVPQSPWRYVNRVMEDQGLHGEWAFVREEPRHMAGLYDSTDGPSCVCWWAPQGLNRWWQPHYFFTRTVACPPCGRLEQETASTFGDIVKQHIPSMGPMLVSTPGVWDPNNVGARHCLWCFPTTS